MTAPVFDPVYSVAQRERLFVWMRFIALALLASVALLAPAEPPADWKLIWSIAAIGGLLNAIAWATLVFVRAGRAAPTVALLAAAGDVVFLLIFLLLSGGARSALWLFVPLLIAAITLRYAMTGGLMAALLYAMLYVILNVPAEGPSLDLLYRGLVTVLAFAGMALMVGWLMRHERTQALADRERAQRALQRSQRDVTSFTQLSGMLSSNTNYQATLQQMLDLSLRSLHTRERGDERLKGMILLLEPGRDDLLTVAAANSLPAADAARQPAVRVGGAIQTALSTVERQIVVAARADPVLGRFEAAAPGVTAVVVPLRATRTVYGVVVLFGGGDLADTFERRSELIEAYATQAAIAMQNAQLFDQLRQERDRFVDSEERARHELARDLHDGPVNQVASLTMGIDFARRLLERDPDRAKEELEIMQRLAAKTARDMRMTMYRLRPLALEQSGLTPALEQYLSRMQQEHEQPRFKLTVNAPEDFEPRLPTNAAMMVFDIMTEAVNNAIKHARAKTVQIDLRAVGDFLIASTSDDGRGFEVATVTAGYADRGSLGLLNIRERAELAHGEAVIESAPGKGSVITVRVPLAKVE